MPAHNSQDSIRALAELSRKFGSSSAVQKVRLLNAIAQERRVGVRALIRLHDTLCFMRAYPDDRRVLDAVEAVSRRLRDWVLELPAGQSCMRPGLNRRLLPPYLPAT